MMMMMMLSYNNMPLSPPSLPPYLGQCGVGRTGRVSHLTPLPTFNTATSQEEGEKKRVCLLQSANGCEHLCAVTEDGELYTCKPSI